ncbi:MAG: Rieske (2Fe-2S) protein [Gammaproteobacteria bacterium]|nr:Rieske (2Fe-2S) protein [Gammaproteobacteria bacterium]
MPDRSDDPRKGGASLERRTLLKQALGVGVTIPVLINTAGAAEKSAEAKRPQPGDNLVFFTGDREGETIKASDVVDDEMLIVAMPKDPVSGVVRDGSRLNRVTLARVDKTKFKDAAKKYAADDIVAFSAVCTHGGCLVNLWRDDALFCPCHYSRFNPWDGGRVMGGPAQRRLAALPIAIQDDVIVVTDGFVSRVGIRK